MPNFVTVGLGVLVFWSYDTPNFAIFHKNSWSPLQQCKHYRATLYVTTLQCNYII